MNHWGFAPDRRAVLISAAAATAAALMPPKAALATQRIAPALAHLLNAHCADVVAPMPIPDIRVLDGALLGGDVVFRCVTGRELIHAFGVSVDLGWGQPLQCVGAIAPVFPTGGDVALIWPGGVVLSLG